MTTLYERRLNLLERPEHHKLFSGIRHGIEREGLRVTADARLSQTPHPEALGRTLTHPYITTDYSEALLEFITPVHNNISDVLGFLNELHVFSSQKMGDELLWAGSMPSILEGDENIPIARYGTSNSGTIKSIYREGLAHRYGKTMQTIAGLHYNFSLPEDLWRVLGETEGFEGSLQDFQSGFYLSLIRNFRRYSWLLMYLFGTSPAVGKSFFNEAAAAPDSLKELSEDTLYMPYATSLRMSDMGYTNNAQASLDICYNTLNEYVDSLARAIKTPYGPYERIGVKQGDKYLQLSANILQVENEYYSNIRPKRVARRGEKPLSALAREGIEYIEVRCLDINPFEPLGISAEDAHFLDVFLVFNALKDSPEITAGECRRVTENFRKVVEEGRRPGLQLVSEAGEVTLQDWMPRLLEEMMPVARLLDQANGSDRFTASIVRQGKKVMDVSLTPSARLLDRLQGNGGSYIEAVLDLSRQHRQGFLEHEMKQGRQGYFSALSDESIRNQQQIEASDTLSFDEFLQHYLA